MMNAGLGLRASVSVLQMLDGYVAVMENLRREGNWENLRLVHGMLRDHLRDVSYECPDDFGAQVAELWVTWCYWQDVLNELEM